MLKTIKKGFTLIELIAVLAIMPIVLSVIFHVVLSAYKQYNYGIKISNTQEQAKVMLTTISQELKTCRNYKDTTEVSADPRFTSIAIAPGDKKVVYFEGYDNKRYMYVLVKNGSENDLYKYTFDEGVVRNTYKVATDASGKLIYNISALQYNAINDESQNKLPGNVATLVSEPISGYTKEFVHYNTYEDKFYLIANKDGNKYKMPLEIIPNGNLDRTAKKILNNIEDITVTRDTVNNNMCTVYIKAVDGGKVKELYSDVYILQQQK